MIYVDSFLENIMVPFKYGIVVSGDDFCGRQTSITAIQQYIKSCQNTFVQGERRIGKTSLIFESIRRLKSHKLLVVDLLALRTAEELCTRIIKQLIILENNDRFLGSLVRFFTHLRPQISMDPLTNLPTVAFDKGVSISPESLEEVFELIRRTARKKKMVVFFDEFQDILKADNAQWLLAALRSKIQYHDSIPYIYAGSYRNEMDSIFTDSKSPFFKSAIPITVDSIEHDEFARFIKDKFIQTGRTINDDVLHDIFEVTANISGDILQLCEALWSVSNEHDTIDRGTLPQAFQLIFAREQRSYEMILSGLSRNQEKVLIALAKGNNLPVNSSGFLILSGVSQPSSVNAALEKLMERRIIYKKDNRIRFSNPFLATWLKT